MLRGGVADAARALRRRPRRPHARRPRPGQRRHLHALRRHLRIGRRRRLGGRRADDPADGEARLCARLRRQRHGERGDHRAAAAALAQHDHLFAVGGRQHLDRRSLHRRHHPGLHARRRADGRRPGSSRSARLPVRAVSGRPDACFTYSSPPCPASCSSASSSAACARASSPRPKSSCIAVLYALFITAFVYRGLHLGELRRGDARRGAHDRHGAVRHRHRRAPSAG